jgi:hypothetical protein
MAFQRTKGRSVFTQPTGMPDLSGFKSAANAYQQLGQSVSQIGTQIRNRDYNDAIRQAEIDGKTAGVKYTKDEQGQWKLSPLINLDYSQSVKNLPKSDADKVLQAHRKAAVGAYVAAAVNDIKSAASVSYIKNKNDPDKVRADMNGYADGLREQLNDEDVFTQLAPKIESAFLSAENQAFAQQQKESELVGIASLQKNLSINTKELGNLAAVGPVEDDDSSVEGFEMRVQELQDENEVILENLQTLGVNPLKIEQLRSNQQSAIAIRVGQSAIEKIFTQNGDYGYSSSLEAIEEIVDEAYSNPDIDEEQIRTALTVTANSLQRLKQAELTEDSKVRESAYQNIISRVINGESVVDMISNQDPILSVLEPTQVFSALQQSKASDQQRINEEFSPAKDLILNWEDVIASGDPVGESQMVSAFLKVRKMHENGQIELAEFYEVKAQYLKYFDTKTRSPQRTVVSSTLKRELSDFSSYQVQPETFIRKIPDLIKSGVIGDGVGAGWATEDAYLADVSKYKKAMRKRKDEIVLAQTAQSKLSLSMTLSDKESEAYVKSFGYDKAIMPDGQSVKIDLFSNDESVFQASADTAASFALNSQGLLLPEVKDLIKQARYSEEATDRAVRVMGQTMDIMVSQSDKPRYAIMYDLFEKNNISEEERTYMTLANSVGISVAQEIVKNPVDYNRGLNNYFGTRIKDGNAEELADEFLQETFRKTLTMDVPFGIGSPVLMTLSSALGINENDPERERFIQEFADTHNISTDDVNKVVLNNPVVKNSIKDLFYSRLLQHGKAVAPEQIMFGVLTSIGKRYGLEENERTGKIEMVESPVLTHAQSTVPMDDVAGRNAKPVVNLTHEMIVNDVVQAVNSVPGIANESFYSALQEVGSGSSIKFFANDNMGGKPSYTVALYDKLGVPYILSDNYRYDFAYSSQNESYRNALQEVRSSKIKRFLSLGGLLDRGLLQNTFEKWEESRQPSSFDPLIKKVNEIYFGLGQNSDYLRMDESIEPFTTEDIEELWRLKETVLSLGFK